METSSLAFSAKISTTTLSRDENTHHELSVNSESSASGGSIDSNNKSITSEPLMGLGENGALTFLHTGSACIDLFFDVVPGKGMDNARLECLLDSAWKEDPLLTLKIIFQLGDPRKGKGDRFNFYRCMLWLYHESYDTFMLNLQYVPRFSCYKSLLDILLLVCRGPNALDDKRKRASWEEKRKRRKETNRLHMEEFFENLPMETKQEWNVENCKYKSARGRKIWKDIKLRDMFDEFIRLKDLEKSKKALKSRIAKEASLREYANVRRNEDTKYSAFYDAVADIFSNGLQDEHKNILDGSMPLSGLVAKWAPKSGGSHDRYTNIVDGIVERLFPQSAYRLPGGTHADYLSFMRDQYRKVYLSPQHRKAQVPEHFIGSGEWHLVNYERMASRCRHLHGHIYEKHDKERYRKYIQDAKNDLMQGKKIKKISAGTLLPHEIIRKIQSYTRTATDIEVANLQWMRLVQDTQKSGKLPPAIPICDVSGSMYGTPMEVAIALSLLISDIAPAPFKNKIVTFSETPEFVTTTPEGKLDNLSERVFKIADMDWGYNTNFQAVFDLLLNSAKFYNVKANDMPKVLFCFSDMEFDQCEEGGCATDLEQIRKKYSMHGYEVPHIVFWNLRPSRSKPSSFTHDGVSLLSGFSAGLMKSFLSNNFSDITPLGELIGCLKPYEVLSLAKS